MTDPALNIIDYEAAKKIALHPDAQQRLNLASNTNTPPEILFFLANDSDVNVRLAVANNAATPAKASQILAQDAEIDIRQTIAHKISRLFPHLSEDKQSQLYHITVQILEILVADQIAEIRIALSSALAEFADTPPHIARQLADDVEQRVAEPILRYCAALSDNDLVAIISRQPIPWVINAITERPVLSLTVSDAIVRTGDHDAVIALAKYIGTQLSSATIKRLQERARGIQVLGDALSTHNSLPLPMLQRIKHFVTRTVRQALDFSGLVEHAAIDQVEDAVERRMETTMQFNAGESPRDRALDLFKTGQLNETSVGDALAVRNDEFIIAALALLANIPYGLVEKILAHQSAKSIVALCWKAGLSARFALNLQRSHIGRIPHTQLLYPKSGEHYTLSAEEMKWQLEFFGIH